MNAENAEGVARYTKTHEYLQEFDVYIRNPYKQTLSEMSRCVCGYCIVEIIVAAWDTSDRYLVSTLSQATIIKVAESFGHMSSVA